MLRLKELYKAFVPPILDNQIRLIINQISTKGGYFSGPYSDWAQATQKATGYDADEIIKTVRQAALSQKLNHTFMRDGLELESPDYSHPLLTALLSMFLEKSEINVLDFGGGLGSTYYNTKCFISNDKFKLNWHIVEQPHFVHIGQTDHQTENLSFFNDISQVTSKIDMVILSSVLQYLPDAFDLIQKIKAQNYRYIFIDRISCHVDKAKETTIMVEHVPTHIYKASYPCRIFNYDELLNTFKDRYDIVYEFIANEGFQNLGNLNLVYKGVFLKLK
jgi:putative methyltransferase (TIGR04325 family)